MKTLEDAEGCPCAGPPSLLKVTQISVETTSLEDSVKPTLLGRFSASIRSQLLVVAPQAYQGSPARSGSAPVPKEAQCRQTSRRWRGRTERSGVGGAEEVWTVAGVTNAASTGKSGCGRKCHLEREELNCSNQLGGELFPTPGCGQDWSTEEGGAESARGAQALLPCRIQASASGIHVQHSPC